LLFILAGTDDRYALRFCGVESLLKQFPHQASLAIAPNSIKRHRFMKRIKFAPRSLEFSRKVYGT